VSSRIRVVLFDIGGVLVELSGVPTMLAWMDNRITGEELMRLWLESPSVRAFETGRIAPETFVTELISEMSLPVEADDLVREFTRWPRGLFPGALDLIGRIPTKYTRATLSNTNALHWPRISQEFRLEEAFDHHFASHLTGRIKPDEDAFHHVTEKLQCDAEEVLFLDDSPVNVDVAASLGMKAVRVAGLAAAERALDDAGVLNG
jgi:glucose-1-phosphatase